MHARRYDRCIPAPKGMGFPMSVAAVIAALLILHVSQSISARTVGLLNKTCDNNRQRGLVRTGA